MCVFALGYIHTPTHGVCVCVFALVYIHTTTHGECVCVFALGYIHTPTGLCVCVCVAWGACCVWERQRVRETYSRLYHGLRESIYVSM